MNRNILDRLAAGPVLGDGGYIIEAMREATDVYLTAQPVAFACTDRIPWFTANPAFPDSPMSETEFNWEHRHRAEPAVHA